MKDVDIKTHEGIEAVLDLMIAKKVAAFELGELKVSFAPEALMTSSMDDFDVSSDNPTRKIDEDLGFEWEE